MSEMESEPFKSLKRKSAEQLSIVQQPEPVTQSLPLPLTVDQKLPINSSSPSREQVDEPKPSLLTPFVKEPPAKQLPVPLSSAVSTVAVSVTEPVTEAIAIAPATQKLLPKDVKCSDSIVNHTESPAIAATGGQCPAYTPLYAPYTVCRF